MLELFNISYTSVALSLLKKIKPHLVDSISGKFWNSSILILSVLLFWNSFLACLLGIIFFGLDLLKLYIFLYCLSRFLNPAKIATTYFVEAIEQLPMEKQLEIGEELILRKKEQYSEQLKAFVNNISDSELADMLKRVNDEEEAENAKDV